jgi:hypothetical protein
MPFYILDPWFLVIISSTPLIAFSKGAGQVDRYTRTSLKVSLMVSTALSHAAWTTCVNRTIGHSWDRGFSDVVWRY